MIVLGFSGIRDGGYYRSNYGLRFVGHDASLALVVDGDVVFAAEEERFNREKHTSEFPLGALDAALDVAGIGLEDIDLLAYTWKVSLRRLLNMHIYHGPRVPLRHALSLAWTGQRVVRDLMSPRRIARQFQEAVGRELPPCRGVSHHLGHVACAYYPSPFDNAAVLTVDGQGEDESGTLGEWRGTRYRSIQSVRSPNSIGILYGMITDFLGMRAGWDEYKVMGMASFGDPARFASGFDSLVRLASKGRYRTDRTAMVFKPGYCDSMLAEVFGIAPRKSADELEAIHFDLAAALQSATERVLFHMLRYLRECTDSSNLCLAGGVFQNSVINGKILRSELFEHVYVPPVPGDDGGPMGAALHLEHLISKRSRQEVGFSVFAGPGFDEREIENALRAYSRLVVERPANWSDHVATQLADGKVIACFQGKMEYGPRALGHRSILADPRRREMRDRVNRAIKHREEFRPFAGSVPLEEVLNWFELQAPSPYMQFVVPVTPDALDRIPAVVHHGTCRAQTVDAKDDPVFHALLERFGELTGVPVLLNTSFNDADEPIVCTPEDALASFSRMELDALAIGPFFVTHGDRDG